MSDDPALSDPNESAGGPVEGGTAVGGPGKPPPVPKATWAISPPPELGPPAPAKVAGSEAGVVAKPWDDAPSASPPVSWREWAAVVLLVVLADVTLYRTHGFAGFAAWFFAGLLLVTAGAPRPQFRWGTWITGLMLLALGAKLLWCGNAFLVVAGFVLLVALAMALAGQRPYLIELGLYGVTAIPAGVAACLGRGGSREPWSSPNSFWRWLSVALPLAAVGGFGLLFVLANPDLVDAARRLLVTFWEQIHLFTPRVEQVMLWAAVALITLGLWRPIIKRAIVPRAFLQGPFTADAAPAAAPLYPALRNTLAAVIGLFAVYLGFEFATLWFREFPEGFYYAGYAHEGAAWLTVALALASMVLSAVFRGTVLRDPRVVRLRRLAWIWSAENFLLALAVYHRMWIYVDFNGMTRMRTVGLFGISAVVVGFLLVLVKIARQHDFLWLVQRHLWTVALATYLLALTPVDRMVHTYNVRRVLAGDPAPVVQISVHPISADGYLVLHPLVESEDQIIREGIRALLAERAREAEAAAEKNARLGWTTFQAAEYLLLDHLRSIKTDWEVYADPADRADALARFHEYAYQWY